MNTQVRPPIDPRIRQRRIAVRREEGRRRLRLLVGVVTVSGLVVGGWAATRSPLLDVDRVDVVGAARTPRDALVAASGHPLRRRPWSTSTRAARSGRVAAAAVGARAPRSPAGGPTRSSSSVVERAPVAVAPAAGRRVGRWSTRPGRSWPWSASAAEQPAGPRRASPPPGPPGSVLGGAGGRPAGGGRGRARRPAAPGRRGAGRAAEGGVELRLQPGGHGAPRAAPSSSTTSSGRHSRCWARSTPQTLATLDVRIPESPVLTRLEPGR